MKSMFPILSAGLAALLAGCAATPVVVAPVAPNPAGSQSLSATGRLQVFSSLVEQSDDQNQAGDGSPFWYQHSDYSIYTPGGKLVKRVGNTVGHYAQSPDAVALPAGQYVVKARASDYSWVKVPVTVEPGRTTRVHLDDNWKLPAGIPKSALVSLPNGNPVGWRADVAKESGIN